MIQGKLEEMTKIQSGFGNYGNGLGQILSETAGTGQQMVGEQKGQANETTDSKAFIPITAKNRIWDVEAISQISGRAKTSGQSQVSGLESFKSSTLRKTMETLQDFHDTMDGEISLSSMEDSLSRAESAYEKLLEQVSHYVERGTKWYAGIHVHREEEKAVLPVMSTLLIKLYSLGNIFDHIENLSYDYLMKNQRENATLREVIESREALSVEGNMPSVNQQSGQIDRTAYQMKKRSPGQENITLNKRQELLQRELPTLKNGSKEEDRARYIRELKAIATMVDDLELQSSDAEEREDVKIDFIDISKMIHILSQNPFLLTGKETGEREGNYRDEDLRLAAEYARKTQGMTVADALLHIDQLRQERAETAAADSIKAGGAMSQVLIDIKEKRVLRTSKDTGGLKGQRAKNNFNYDEAMSRLGEITGLGSLAGARTTYYEDTEGKLQYGTNMEKASGKQARDVKLSFGNEEVDKNMRGGRYNIFGYGSPEELKKNGSLIISSFKLQILDYISYHRDRHYENFFIDLEADDPTQAFVGIDNDNVFGKGTDGLKRKRLISYKQHAEKDYEGSNRTVIFGPDEIKHKLDYKHVTSTLKGFACIPKETLQQIMALDERKIEEGMRPYLDRAARMAMMTRVRSLKEYAKTKAKKVDVYSPEGMREFKKETMKVMVNTIMNNRTDDDILGNAGDFSLSRTAPGILTRAIMMQYFNLDGLIKDKNNPGEYIYRPSYEYIREGQSPEEYFATSNRKARNQDYWRVFDAMIQESGQTREQLWDYYMEQIYGARRNEKEQEENIKKARELFVTGKMKMSAFWSDKDML